MWVIIVAGFVMLIVGLARHEKAQEQVRTEQRYGTKPDDPVSSGGSAMLAVTGAVLAIVGAGIAMSNAF